MDFGHGSQHEYTWFYNNNGNQERKPRFMERLHAMDAHVLKAVDKWDRVFLLDSNDEYIVNMLYRKG